MRACPPNGAKIYYPVLLRTIREGRSDGRPQHRCPGPTESNPTDHTSIVSKILQVNLDRLVHAQSVESARIEFKASWDVNTTGPQALMTICAFANDYQNLNGGYIVFGVAQEEGRPVLPPKGLTPSEIEQAQQWLRGRCQSLKPSVEPVFSPETYCDRHILVVWTPASQHRPHRAPDARSGAWKYWIRVGESTVNAEVSGRLEILLEQTARVPWDDRIALEARVEDLRETVVREHLRDVRSGLLDLTDTRDLYRRMGLCSRVNDHEAPRNVGLLFFSDEPTKWFAGARIEVARFAADRAGKVQDERIFRGPLADQVRGCLSYFEGLSHAHLQKHRDRNQVRGWVSYPQIAFREALVNAVYHRAYRKDTVEPTKVFLYPDRVEIISYPGPVPGIEAHHLVREGQIPPIPARNRRIGEFLKELDLAEGRFTGVPQIYDSMQQNGSPAPKFDFDDAKSYFRVTLPAHPEYAAVSALQDAAYLRTVGSVEDAFNRVLNAWESDTSSAALAAEVIRMQVDRGNIAEAKDAWDRFREHGPEFGRAHVANTLVDALLEAGEDTLARAILDDIAEVPSSADAIDTAILAKRLGEQRVAHRYFDRAGDMVLTDARALHEFAQTKMRLATEAYRRRNPSWREVNTRLLSEARDQLERVTLMDAPPTRHAWAWRDLALVRQRLQAPRSDVVAAYKRASELLPQEERFTVELDGFLARTASAPRRNRDNRRRR